MYICSQSRQVQENDVIQADFIYRVPQGVTKAYFSANLPYSLHDFEVFHEKIQDLLASQRNSQIYYHREIMADSIDELPIYLCTFTSSNNISSYQAKEPEIWPTKDVRPYLLKNRPQILITARVHPSEVSSSFWLQGFISNLIVNHSFSVLLEIFIFRVVPFMNPDGVQNGHYRFDNFLHNLNRFYGHSSPQKTPSVSVVESLMNSLREKQKLFMFVDVHGHNSPKPAFMFGNFSLNLYQSLENRTFVRLLDCVSEGNFDSFECEFSKHNMKVKEKYDQHSKEASARVYAFRGNSQSENLRGSSKINNEYYVEHSYTLEIFPYLNSMKKCIKKAAPSQQNSNSYRTLPKSIVSLRKSESISQNIIMEPTYKEIIETYYKLGENFLISLLQILGLSNTQFFSENENIEHIRKRVFRELTKQIEFYDRANKLRVKQINREVQERYLIKWNLIEGYSQFIATNTNYLKVMKARNYKNYMQEVYQELNVRKQKEKAESRKKALSNVNSKSQKEQKVEENINELENEKNERNIQNTQPFQVTIISSKKKKKHEENRFSKAIKDFELDPKFAYDQRSPTNSRSPRKFKIENNVPRNQGFSNIYHKFNNKDKNTIQQLEQRIRKLIFRHKTESEIFEENIEKFPINTVENGMANCKREAEDYCSSKKQKRNEKSLSRNQKKTPPSRSHNKHIRTEVNCKNVRVHEFNDQNILGKGNRKEARMTEISQSVYSRMQGIIRKVSIKNIGNENRHLETIEREDDYKPIKSSHLIQMNGKKSTSKGKEISFKDEIKPVFPDSSKNFITMQSNVLLPPMSHPSIDDRVSISEHATILHSKLRGHQSIKHKMKKADHVREKSEQDPQDMLNNYRAMAASSGNRLEFINRSRKMLSEKKKEEFHHLPIINEFEMITEMRKK